MVGARNLGKRYGSRWLFRHIEFDLEPGDCLVVTGPNGAGKSTFLKTLVGLVEASEGQATLPEAFGYSALDLALYPALTAAEHLELSGDLRGIQARTEELLREVGLSGARDQLSQEFSTGMRARLKLAMALQQSPSLLILDEPGASLDQSGRDLIEQIIGQQRARGAVILATNDPAERRFATHEMVIGG